MTHAACENTATMPGHLADAFAVAVGVERWPMLLPGYRRVRAHGRSGAGHAYQFRARLGPALVEWTAEQIVDATAGRITYVHVRGPMRGLVSEWRLAQDGEHVAITVGHLWPDPAPIVGGVVAAVACRALAAPLTDQTLAAIASVMRSGQAAAIRRLTDAHSRGQPTSA